MGKRSRIAPQRVPTKRQLSRWEREKRVKRYVYIAFAAVVFLVLFIPAFGFAREYVLKGQEPVARVNQSTLTLSDFSKLLNLNSFQLDQEIANLQSVGGQSSDQLQNSLQYLEQARSSLPYEIVDQWTKDQLVRQEASARGITVGAAEVTAAMKPQEDPNTPPDENPTALSDEEFESRYNAFLKQANTTDAFYRHLTESSLLEKKLRDSLGEDIKSPAPQVRVQAIITATEDDAKAVLDRLGNGEDFAQVAKEASQDPQSKDNGGELGWVPRGLMDETLEDAVFSAPVGQLSGPIDSAQGYVVFKVSEKTDSRDIEPSTMDQLKANSFERWYNQAYSDNTVENKLTPDQVAWAQKQIRRR